MANDFLSFLSGIGSTPTPVYGTSAEDAALRQQMAGGLNYWNNTTPAQTGYLPGSSRLGSADQTPAQMYAPSYGGSGAVRPVQTTSVGPINRATAANNYFGQALTYVPASGARSAADLLTGIGAYGGSSRLGQPETAVAAANQMATGGSPRAYAPWGTYSRSLAYNAFNTPPAPTPNVQLPRPRPGYAPNAMDIAAINSQQPKPANPGIGGALLGNGVMSPLIPPQQPPADGSSPLPVWADDTPTAPTAGSGYTVPGTPRPMSGAERYSLANAAGVQAALARQAAATGTAGGYQYVNGKKVGYAPQTIGNLVYTPTNPATAYGLANAAGQIAALNRQAVALTKGQKTEVQKLQAKGLSASQAYAAANAKPGSVSAFEQKASGRPSGSYSDGREPSGTGSLW